MKTIRVSDEAYTVLMEVLGLMQYRKGEKVSLSEVIDKIVEFVPENLRRFSKSELEKVGEDHE